jgi:hypothetical protein
MYLPDSKSYLPTSELIRLAKAEKLYLGSKKPENFVRYLTKVGILPSPKRLRASGQIKTIGHYQASSLEILRDVTSKINSGRTIAGIRGDYRLDSPTSPSTSRAQFSLNLLSAARFVFSSLILAVFMIGSLFSSNSGLTGVASIIQGNSVQASSNSDSLAPSQDARSSGHSIAGATLTTAGNTVFGGTFLVVVAETKSVPSQNLGDLLTEGKVKLSDSALLVQKLTGGQDAASNLDQPTVLIPNTTESGEATFAAGTSRTAVGSAQVTSVSRILVSFRGDYAPATRYCISEVRDHDSFILGLDTAISADTSFNWWVVN